MSTSKPKLKHKLEYAAARFAAVLFSLLPLELASAFGGWIVGRIGPRMKRHQRALTQIRAVFPELEDKEVQRIAAQSWNNLGRSIAELPRLDQILSSSDRISFDDPGDLLRSLRESQTGAVFTAGHFGNWELVPGLSRFAGLPLTAFYREMSNKLVEPWLRDVRLRAIPRGNLVASSSQGVAAASAAIKRKEGVGVLADLFEPSGIETEFLGFPTRSLSLPATLALRGRIPTIMLVAVLRKPGVRFQVVVRGVDVAKTGKLRDRIARTTHCIDRELETLIRAHPEQWFWSTNRWKGTQLPPQQARPEKPVS
jgi:KDO2-lipid IV(A) lauroyltransferase